MNGLDRDLSYQGHVTEIEFATGHTGLNKTILCHQTRNNGSPKRGLLPDWTFQFSSL